MRTNGAVQVTYAGFPLYRYWADTKPDSAKGEGFESKWFVVSAKGALVKHAVEASSKTTTTPATAWG
jgi:hypothetical protein